MAEPNERREEGKEPGAEPPGDFVSDEHRSDTARFIEEVKDLAKRRGAAAPGTGPPPKQSSG